jgi:HAD superfamily hydrolase (TIGR01549 family)
MRDREEKDLKQLYQAIDSCSLISFDIFDTAVLRKVLKPEDVFTLVCDQLKLKYDFKRLRLNAENEVWKSKLCDDPKAEVTLDEIYTQLSKHVSPIKDAAEVVKLKQKEIETEILVSQRNEFIYAAYEYCIKKNKSIIFTSDMYLSKKTLKKVLVKNGYENYKDLFVSCEELKSKRTGDLYDYIIQKYNLHPREILHIGDNEKTDIHVALNKGLKTYYYKKCIRVARENKNYAMLEDVFADADISDPFVSIWLAIIVNKFYSWRPLRSCEFYYRYGFWYASVVVLGFVKWIHAESIKKKVEKIYFLARDGFIPYKVYQKMKKANASNIDCDYIYTSRRALNIPGISRLDETSFNLLCELVENREVRFYIDRINLNGLDYREEIINSGFKNEKEIVDDTNKPKLKVLFRKIEKDLLAKTSEDRRVVYKYLKETGMLNRGNIALVDIGWRGSMQKAYENLVTNLIKKKQIIHGFYLGLFSKNISKVMIRNHRNMEGYLLNFGLPEENKELVEKYTVILETMFIAPHGSTIGYENKGNKTVPVFDEENEVNLEEQKYLEAGIMDFADEFIAFYKDINVGVNVIVKPIKRIATKPTYEEGVKIGAFVYGASFGSHDNKTYLAKPPAFRELIKTPFNTLCGFKKTNWKEGYLVQLHMLRLNPFIVCVNKLIKRISPWRGGR